MAPCGRFILPSLLGNDEPPATTLCESVTRSNWKVKMNSRSEMAVKESTESENRNGNRNGKCDQTRLPLYYGDDELTGRGRKS